MVTYGDGLVLGGQPRHIAFAQMRRAVCQRRLSFLFLLAAVSCFFTYYGIIYKFIVIMCSFLSGTYLQKKAKMLRNMIFYTVC